MTHTVTNQTRTAQAVRVAGKKGEMKYDTLAPGETKDLAVDLENPVIKSKINKGVFGIKEHGKKKEGD